MKGITFTTPGRLSVAMSLIFGLATIAAAPTVEAATIEQVDIINGNVDVNEDGVISTSSTLDDATNLLLTCDDATAIQVDIIDGKVDVTEGGLIQNSDDASNCDLNDLVGGVPSTNQVDICDGLVEVTEGPCPAGADDDASDVRLIKLP